MSKISKSHYPQWANKPLKKFTKSRYRMNKRNYIFRLISNPEDCDSIIINKWKFADNIYNWD